MKIDKTTSLYCVSLTDGDHGHVSRISLTGLFDMVRGGTNTGDIMLFTEEEEAEEYGERLNLIQKGQALLEELDNELLEKIVSTIVGGRIQ